VADQFPAACGVASIDMHFDRSTFSMIMPLKRKAGQAAVAYTVIRLASFAEEPDEWKSLCPVP